MADLMRRNPARSVLMFFADDLNGKIIHALNPKLIAVPFSLGRNTYLDKIARIGVSLNRAHSQRPFSVRLSKGTFNFYTGICRRDENEVRAVFIPHPGSLRLNEQSQRRVVSELTQTLSNFR